VPVYPDHLLVLTEPILKFSSIGMIKRPAQGEGKVLCRGFDTIAVFDLNHRHEAIQGVAAEALPTLILDEMGDLFLMFGDEVSTEKHQSHSIVILNLATGWALPILGIGGRRKARSILPSLVDVDDATLRTDGWFGVAELLEVRIIQVRPWALSGR